MMILSERIEIINGDGFSRRIRVREYTDSQISLMKSRSFTLGFCVGLVPLSLLLAAAFAVGYLSK
jgi:hypothetical protein